VQPVRLADMRRRGATVLVGTLLLALLLWQAGDVKVPYVELGPGPTYNTLGSADGHPVITVTNAPTSESAGQLRLMTVGVHPELTLLQAIRGWLADDYAVVPRELVYPPNKTEQQVDQENANDFKQSQTSAETVALRKLGYPVQVTITELVAGAPADGVLRVGDILTSVDGTSVSSVQKLTELIRAKPAGTPRVLGYTRGTSSGQATLATVKADDGNPRIGVRVEQKQPHPFDLSIQLDRIGGPSAGLMFALGIYDKLSPPDLTGGRIIAGTGSIDDEGRVGPIGGIPQKLLAAKLAHATIFLTPEANCAEAVANARPGLMLLKVATFDGALQALQTLRDGGTPALCSG
jgi:PDZ domain-containing protein